VRRLLVVGAVAAVAGLVFAFVPSLVGGLTPTYGAVVLVGLLATVYGVQRLRGRGAVERRYARPPDREGRPSPPVPGEAFDSRLDGLAPASTREGRAARAAVRERLEVAAVNVLAKEGLDPDEARDRLESGRWTDDPLAAEFFGPETDEAGGPGERVRSLFGDRTGFETRARRTAAAIAARARGDR
jgi:hypothetical protein